MLLCAALRLTAGQPFLSAVIWNLCGNRILSGRCEWWAWSLTLLYTSNGLCGWENHMSESRGRAKKRGEELMNWRVSLCDVYCLAYWEALDTAALPSAAAVILSQPISPAQSAPKIACSSAQK